jgi:hypothetical protein
VAVAAVGGRVVAVALAAVVAAESAAGAVHFESKAGPVKDAVENVFGEMTAVKG